jgi:hypothetical protein
MPKSFKSDTSKYSHVKDLATTGEAQTHVRLGWEYIDIYAEVDRDSHAMQTRIIYLVGWPKALGEPIEPPNKGGLPKFDGGPSAN